jgi:hypothetical protein
MRRHFGTLILGVALAAVGPLSTQASSAGASRVTTVKVSIYGNPAPTVIGKIVYLPKTVKVGKVIFEITNRSNDFHTFEINGVVSRLMGPNRGQAVITVTFKKRGLYAGTVPDSEEAGIGGQLRVT